MNNALRDRTKQFALRIIRLYSRLPKTTEAQVVGKQLLRSGPSSAANYREACRARSDAEMISKLGIVEQELDETMLWLELLAEGNIVRAELLEDIRDETEQLIKITVSAIKSLRSRRTG
jgi:four helix bundle protein